MWSNGGHESETTSCLDEEAIDQLYVVGGWVTLMTLERKSEKKPRNKNKKRSRRSSSNPGAKG